MEGAHTPTDFDAMFSRDSDPWNFQTLWYEARKRALTLACLPKQHYGRVYEPGCANGELSAELAMRCDYLLASDGAAAAVQLARDRLADAPGATVVQAHTPAQWPEGSFDLVVISELAYYLSPAEVAHLARRAHASLRPGGTVLACHWRWPIPGCTLDGDQVHAVLAETLAMPLVSSHREPDVCLDVWCLEACSVAMREGLTPSDVPPRP